MKTKIFILIVMLPWSLFAQLTVDAGEDRHVCQNFDVVAETIQLQGIASGGVEPYSYAWSVEPITLIPGTIVYASHLLNDTTLAQPTISEIVDACFYLTVTDATGNSATDSIRITTSTFFQALGYWSFTIQEGDSIYLDYGSNLGGGVGELTYQWQPSEGLSRTDLPTGFWAKPNVSTNYYLTITDEMGCSVTGSPYYYITVGCVGIEEMNNVVLNCYPNPAGDFIMVEIQSGQKQLSAQITDLSGKVVTNSILTEGNNQININNLPSGFYLLSVQNAQKVLYTTKVIVN